MSFYEENPRDIPVICKGNYQSHLKHIIRGFFLAIFNSARVAGIRESKH